MVVWKIASKFHDLVSCNVHFLNGNIYSPLWGGPLDAETQTLLPNLIQLSHEYKVLTLESQPNFIIKNKMNVTQRSYEILLQISESAPVLIYKYCNEYNRIQKGLPAAEPKLDSF
jgi:hypothetical protein